MIPRFNRCLNITSSGYQISFGPIGLTSKAARERAKEAASVIRFRFPTAMRPVSRHGNPRNEQKRTTARTISPKMNELWQLIQSANSGASAKNQRAVARAAQLKNEQFA